MDLEKKSDLRASDADRDTVAGRLGDALAEGRLTPEEHAERLDRLYETKTYAELEVLTGDLPGEPHTPKISLLKDDQADLEAPVRGPNTIVAVFGGAERKGRWLAEPHTSITVVFGGVELDYRRAVLTRREVVVDVRCVFGGIEITVPPGVRVETNVSAIFGGCEDPENDTVDPDAPVIRLTGFVLFGGISFKRRLSKDRQRELRENRRRERREHREERRLAQLERREQRRNR